MQPLILLQVSAGNLDRSYRRAPRGAGDEGGAEGAGICHLCMCGKNGIEWEDLTPVWNMHAVPFSCAMWYVLYTYVRFFLHLFLLGLSYSYFTEESSWTSYESIAQWRAWSTLGQGKCVYKKVIARWRCEWTPKVLQIWPLALLAPWGWQTLLWVWHTNDEPSCSWIQRWHTVCIYQSKILGLLQENQSSEFHHQDWPAHLQCNWGRGKLEQSCRDKQYVQILARPLWGTCWFGAGKPTARILGNFNALCIFCVCLNTCDLCYISL